MSEPANFLARWSRRKQEAGRAPEEEARRPDADEQAAAAETNAGNEADADTTEKPEFDVSSLPSLESIGADTDVRAFLQKGVPLDLTRAALRRVWTADPAIRDFIGIAENQWDFATGSDLPGFGPLEATDELRRIAGNIVKEGRLPELPLERPDATGVGSQASEKTMESEPSEPDGPPQVVEPEPAAGIVGSATTGSDTSERHEEPAQIAGTVDVALQQERPSEQALAPRRRGHGGALPQ